MNSIICWIGRTVVGKQQVFSQSVLFRSIFSRCSIIGFSVTIHGAVRCRTVLVIKYCRTEFSHSRMISERSAQRHVYKRQIRDHKLLDLQSVQGHQKVLEPGDHQIELKGRFKLTIIIVIDVNFKRSGYKILDTKKSTACYTQLIKIIEGK